jgi:molybdopterin molybdotransferase
MISYEDALKKVLENTRILKEEEKLLIESAGQVLAGDVYSGLHLPQTSISARDGYAVKFSDIKGATKDKPVILRIISTARAGHVMKKAVKTGTAIRIMTGSVLPNGADCVVRFEDTDEPGDKSGPNKSKPSQVRIYAAIGPGKNVRPAGSSVRKWTLIVPKGTLIGPAQISALAYTGKVRIKAIRRPVVAIIATGDELVNPGNPLAPGKTYNCNTTAIASLVEHYGGIPKILGIARDKEAALISKIRRGMTADAIITIGGVSKGDYDLVRLVLGKLGRLVFFRIKMGPGAAVAFGVIKRPSANGAHTSIPVFSLAGPPNGCLINFETLVRPALLKMRGVTALDHPMVEATAADSISGVMPIAFARYTYLEEIQGKYRVTLNIAERSGMLASMASANSLTIIPEGSVVKSGDTIKVLPLNWLQDRSLL